MLTAQSGASPNYNNNSNSSNNSSNNNSSSDSVGTHPQQSIDRGASVASPAVDCIDDGGATPCSRDRARQAALSRASSVESAWNATVSKATLSLSRRSILTSSGADAPPASSASAFASASSSCWTGHGTPIGRRQQQQQQQQQQRCQVT